VRFRELSAAEITPHPMMRVVSGDIIGSQPGQEELRYFAGPLPAFAASTVRVADHPLRARKRDLRAQPIFMERRLTGS